MSQAISYIVYDLIQIVYSDKNGFFQLWQGFGRGVRSAQAMLEGFSLQMQPLFHIIICPSFRKYQMNYLLPKIT